MNVLEDFQARKRVNKEKAEALAGKDKLFSTLRVITFIALIVTIVFFANERMPYAITISIVSFVILFGGLLKSHNKLITRRNKHKFLASINEDEEKRLQGDLKGFEQGKEYLSQDHHYAKDIDVFGNNSLFQLLNRSTTKLGRDRLAEWLSNTTKLDTILKRQEAVKELKNDINWRQEFQASGMLRNREVVDSNSLIKWVNTPNQVSNKNVALVLGYILPLLILTALALYFFIGLSFYVTLTLAFVNGFFLKKYSFLITDITEQTNNGYAALLSFSRMINSVENKPFESPYLSELQQSFNNEGQPASKSILALKKLLEFINGRANWFYIFFNLFLMFDLHLLMKIEKWKRKNQQHVNQWFDSLGQLETLNSLAGYAYANEEYSFPQIKEGEYSINAQSIGHPLIKADERVNNDFMMEGQGSIALITGSNMSGKSTFLRTIGVNLVLAYSGGPVCASKMSASIFQLFTGMRTEDNLEEHISSFYAELKRIKQLLTLLKNTERPVFFMLDEILKGTNSKDRHAGAEALIRQLSDKNVMGFVSTHDLALGKLSEELSRMTNYSFNSTIKDDKIHFNYKLEDGLCHSFNASKLMEQIGIELSKK